MACGVGPVADVSQGIAKETHDVEALFKCAFTTLDGYSGFSMKNILNKRVSRNEEVRVTIDTSPYSMMTLHVQSVLARALFAMYVSRSLTPPR